MSRGSPFLPLLLLFFSFVLLIPPPWYSRFPPSLPETGLSLRFASPSPPISFVSCGSLPFCLARKKQPILYPVQSSLALYETKKIASTFNTHHSFMTVRLRFN